MIDLGGCQTDQLSAASYWYQFLVGLTSPLYMVLLCFSA